MLARIHLDILREDFGDFFSGWGDQQFTNAISDGIKTAVERCLRGFFGPSLLKVHIEDSITAQCVDGYNNLGLDLAAIWRLGYFYVHGLRFEIDLPNETSVSDWQFVAGPNVSFDHWIAEASGQPTVKERAMKRWRRYRFSVPRLRVASAAVVHDPSVIEKCCCDAATLKPFNNGFGALLTFHCFVCGKKYLCECFRGIAEKQIERPNFDTSRHRALLAETQYRSEICHLCRGVPSTTGIRQHNESTVRAYYRPYVDAFAQKMDFDWKAAENHVRDRLGVPRIGEGWIAEANLLRIVQSLFPDRNVVHQASPDGMGRQRFDVYIPELKLAIEYNGEQHYYPIERFGGQTGFESTKLRDQEKRKKAQEVGIVIVEFRYDEDITPDLVRTRLEAVSTFR